MTPGQGELDVSLEDELTAAAADAAAADLERQAALEKAETPAQTRRRKAKPAAAPAPPPADNPIDEELLVGAWAQAELRAELGASRVGTAGIPANVLAYSRSPGMELNSTAARALAGAGGRGDLLIIAVEEGNLATVTRLVHAALALEPELEPE